jgi:hypothetical protein
MKRFVFAGLFFVFGLIILGTATTYVLNGPDKPRPTPPHSTDSSASAAPKAGGGHGAGPPSQQSDDQSQNKPAKPFQSTAMPLPGMVVPSTTSVQQGTLQVQPVPIRPPTSGTPPSVPGVNVDPETASRGKK